MVSHFRALAICALCIALSIGPVSPANIESATDLLARVRQTNEDVFGSLKSFVCDEEIRRFKGSMRDEGRHPIDTISASVSFENGVEHYTDIRQNGHERRTMASIIGAWSTGEFGTLLRQTEDLLRTQPVVFREYRDFDGIPAAIYSMELSRENSPWDLEIQSQHYHVPFRTIAWVSTSSGEILKIERVSTGIPPGLGISEIRWGVILAPLNLNGRTWLLPKAADYTVVYKASGRREWNEINFTNYHRYGSEVALRFQ